MSILKKIISYKKNEGIDGLLNILMSNILRIVSPYFMQCINCLIKSQNKIVFDNFAGKGYGGNSKAICDELRRRKLNVKYVWLLGKEDNSNVPKGIKTVKKDSFRELYELATAKVWVDNCRKADYIRKGKNQYYIQCWHGGVPCLKKVEKDAENELNDWYLRYAKHDSEMADLFLSACKWRDDNYRSAFWYDGEIMPCGTPSSDVYFKDAQRRNKKFRMTYGMPDDVRLVLYAPTFRENNIQNNDDVVDWEAIRLECQIKFGGDWRVVVRFHPLDNYNLEKYKGSTMGMNMCNASNYPDYEDIMIASEIFITDYSGGMFDAFMLKKKTIIYAYDLERYIKSERGFYFDLNDLPAKVAKNNNELADLLKNFDDNEYIGEVEEFNSRIGFYPGGRACEMVADRVESVLRRKVK